MSPKKVLVTGGTGFIGSSLVRRLDELGFCVRVLDSFVRKTKVPDGLQIEFNRGDVRDKKAVREAVKGVDCVVHLAALTDVQESFRSPGLYWEINVDGTRNLLRQSVQAHVGRVVFASSCAVYGEPKCLPIKEAHPKRPLSPYGKSKLEAEHLCLQQSEKNGLSTVMLRLFNVFGPKAASNGYSGVIAEFIRRASQKKPLIVFGDGNQTRDFVFIDDVVEYITRAVGSTATGTYNIGSGVPTSINQVAELTNQLVESSRGTIEHVPSKDGEIRNICAEISHARTTFHYEPAVAFREGLSRTVGFSVFN
jgi:UDP-glucose 4-epimerase